MNRKMLLLIAVIGIALMTMFSGCVGETDEGADEETHEEAEVDEEADAETEVDEEADAETETEVDEEADGEAEASGGH